MFAGLCMFIVTSLWFGSNLTKDTQISAIQSMEGQAKEIIYHPLAKYGGEHRLRGNRRALAAFGTLPQQIRLREMQREILANQNRPPDSAYNINVSLSDNISLDRAIEDTRPPVCKKKIYDLNTLPRASVVIPFFNEALSMLLRTIHSILNRTPSQLLAEIVLVDDCSTHEYLREPLDHYIQLLPKVKLIRNKVREGLIRSRLMGADSTSTNIVVFLDAHTEVNQDWLEPMLQHLQRHPNR